MSVTAQKYLVAALSLALAAALGAVGAVEGRIREKLPWAAASGPLDPQVDRGRQVYEKYSCIACHGPVGVGGVNNVNAQTGGKINGLKFVAESYSKQDLAKKILDGVSRVEKADPNGPQPPLTMPAYRGLIGSQELEDLTQYLFALQPAGPKAKGEEW